MNKESDKVGEYGICYFSRLLFETLLDLNDQKRVYVFQGENFTINKSLASILLV